MHDVHLTVELDRDETGSVRGVTLAIKSSARQLGVTLFLSSEEAYWLSSALEQAAAHVRL